jgi:hypothetical protein
MVMRMPNSTLGHPAEQREPAVERAGTPVAAPTDSDVRPPEGAAKAVAGLAEEKCPVIRASRIMFSSATAGRLKVVYF